MNHKQNKHFLFFVSLISFVLFLGFASIILAVIASIFAQSVSAVPSVNAVPVVYAASSASSTSSTTISPIDAGSMRARVLITNDVSFARSGSAYHVESAQGMLSWYPKSTFLQQVQDMSTEPQANLENNNLVFSWTSPAQEESLLLQSTILTHNAIVPVRDVVQFPFSDVDPDAQMYLGEGEIIDQSPQIRSLAQQLAAGKTDAYDVVFTLADWTTKNVNYSLASLGQPAIQKSSQVLQSRYGKCDEMTALFISMNRAVGIPARFVAGYAYSNSEQYRFGWGGHGWAEVWLPGQGWIPFDVTYGEYGYLDASHVTLKIAPDAKENSIEYSARGNDFELHTKPLDIVITPISLTAADDSAINIQLDAPYTTVGFGSSVFILATVQNNRDYYVSTRLDLAKTTSTEQLSANYQNLLLKPGERRVVPFLVKIDDNLQKGYVYEFPFKIYSRLGPAAKITIKVKEDAEVYDQSVFAEQMLQYSLTTAVPPFSVVCNQGTASYVGGFIMHTCSTDLASTMLNVCERADCKQFPIRSGEFTFNTSARKIGVSTTSYVAKDAENRQSKFFVTSRVVDNAHVVAQLSHPPSVSVDQIFTIRMNVSHTGAQIKNMLVKLQVQHATAEQKIDDMDSIPVLLFTIPANSLRPGENTITATLSSTDELGTPVNTTVTSVISLENVGVMNRILFAFEDFGYWLTNLFAK